MRYVLVLSFFFTSLCLVAQSATHKVVYQCETNISKGKQHDGINTLYFNQHRSMYLHNDWPRKDSTKMNEFTLYFAKGDSTGMPVYIDLKDSVILFKTDYLTSPNRPCYVLKERLPKTKWKIDPTQTKRIGQLNCIRAVGVFGNREYDVWFTPEIAVPFGPYKIGGLPGLILEAQSRDGRVSYSFVSLESNITESVALTLPQKYMDEKAFRLFLTNRLLENEADSTPTGTATIVDPPLEWEIERSKFTFFSEYKRERERKKKRD